MNNLEIRIEETKMMANYTNLLAEQNIVAPSESHILTTFKMAFFGAFNFLKASKHNAEHTVLKFVDSNNEFILAFESVLETDDDGNKSFVVGTVFNEEYLDITENTKVYLNTDSIYISTYKELIKNFISDRDKAASDKLIQLAIAYPFKMIKLYAREIFDGLEETIKVADVEIQDVGIITYNRSDDNNNVEISFALHQNMKQSIKADGNSDLLKLANEAAVA